MGIKGFLCKEKKKIEGMKGGVKKKKMGEVGKVTEIRTKASNKEGRLEKKTTERFSRGARRLHGLITNRAILFSGHVKEAALCIKKLGC